MSDTDKPRMTPKQIADEWEPIGQRRQMLLDLAAAGYVIVHPEDVPQIPPDGGGDSVNYSSVDFAHRFGRDDGWGECRRRIFGGDR